MKDFISRIYKRVLNPRQWKEKPVKLPTKQVDRESRISGHLVWGIVIICVLPLILTLIGLGFAQDSPKAIYTLPKTSFSDMIDVMFYTLAGSFTHTILEWTAFCTAAFTVLFAFIHFSIKGDVTTPIIGVALFCAGAMDAFHTLAADRLIEAVADNKDLIPFTWALCRIFNALIMIIGVGLFLIKPKQRIKGDLRFILITTLIFGGLAYTLIHISAVSPDLPRTQFPDAVITRPYDIIPLVLFLFAGLFIYLPFYRRNPSLFSHALLVSVIPEVAVQFYMAFGSSTLFDNFFNIAHGLKIIAYLVPFSGLALDYIKTYKDEQRSRETLMKVNTKLEHEITERMKVEEKQTQLVSKLEGTNKELKDFAYIISHDLKAPLRAIGSLSHWIGEDYAPCFDEEGQKQMKMLKGRVDRMNNLIEGVLQYSRVGRIKETPIELDLNSLVADVIDSLHQNGTMEIQVKNKLPLVFGEMTPFIQIFQNLISNAIKYMDKPKGKISISCDEDENYWTFAVSDNGPGIDERYYDKIFQIFQTLVPRDDFESTGVGLSIVKKIIDRLGGRIWVESQVGEGSNFLFTLAKIKLSPRLLKLEVNP